MIVTMLTLARKTLKVFIFVFIFFLIGRLSSPYYYDVVSIDFANAISYFIYGNVYAEEVDNIYFYINFSITISLSVLVYYCFIRIIKFILKKRRE